MKKSNFESIVFKRLQADDFAQPQKKPLIQRIWRKLCAKTA